MFCNDWWPIISNSVDQWWFLRFGSLLSSSLGADGGECFFQGRFKPLMTFPALNCCNLHRPLLFYQQSFYQVRWILSSQMIVTKFFLKQDYNVFKMKHLKKNISNHFDIRLGTLNNFLYESSYSHWLYQVTHIHFMKCSASGPKTYTGNIKGKIHQRIKSNFFVISLRYFKHQYP